MSTFNAFYVRKQAGDDAIREAILSLYPRAHIQVLPDFIGAVLSRNSVEPPEQKLADLSAKFATEVIWVTYQTTAESFIFHHWQAGAQLRALWYGCAHEGTWDRAEGQPEPWEAEEFWGEEALASTLECEGIIRKGQTEPSVSSEDAVHAVMDYYGLFDPPADAADVPTAEAAPVSEGTGARVVRISVWVAILCAIALFLWRRSK